MKASCGVFGQHAALTYAKSSPALREHAARAAPPTGVEECHPVKAKPPSLPSGLILVCVDNDEMARMVAESILVRANADTTHSRVLGSSYAEIERLASEVAELEAQFHDRVVLIIDQHMCFDTAEEVRGTEISRALREVHRFDGVILIHSADDDAAANTYYIACGADGSVGKRSGIGGVLEAVATAWHARHGKGSSALRKHAARAAPPTGVEECHPVKAKPPSLPSGLILVCVDNDEMARMVAESILVRANADTTHSRVLGSSYAEIERLASEVAELEAQFHDRVVLIIDQHMCFDTAEEVRGTEISRALREVHRFDGVILIHSADDDAAANTYYIACGADGSVGKRSGIGGVLEAVATAWHARKHS